MKIQKRLTQNMEELQSASALAALKIIRKRIKDLTAGDWRQVIDALKSTTQEWWLSLPRHEQKQFVRHLQSYWDIHRHRMAPNIGHEIEAILHSGHAVKGLFAIGRLRKEELMESVAVPELREQAVNLAKTIVSFTSRRLRSE